MPALQPDTRAFLTYNGFVSASALVSVDDYLHRTEKPSCEYVDGILYPKPMPTKLHALLQKLLMTALEKQGVEALAEVTVRLSPTKYLVPDVIAASVIQSPYPAANPNVSIATPSSSPAISTRR